MPDPERVASAWAEARDLEPEPARRQLTAWAHAYGRITEDAPAPGRTAGARIRTRVLGVDLSLRVVREQVDGVDLLVIVAVEVRRAPPPRSRGDRHGA